MKNEMRCYACGETDGLSLMQHINEKGYTVGVLFACEFCLKNMRGKCVRVIATNEPAGIDVSQFGEKIFQCGELDDSEDPEKPGPENTVSLLRERQRRGFDIVPDSMKTTQEWCVYFGWEIIDLKNWSTGKGNFELIKFDEKITATQFFARMIFVDCRMTRKDAFTMGEISDYVKECRRMFHVKQNS